MKCHSLTTQIFLNCIADTSECINEFSHATMHIRYHIFWDHCILASCFTGEGPEVITEQWSAAWTQPLSQHTHQHGLLEFLLQNRPLVLILYMIFFSKSLRAIFLNYTLGDGQGTFSIFYINQEVTNGNKEMGERTKHQREVEYILVNFSFGGF